MRLLAPLALVALVVGGCGGRAASSSSKPRRSDAQPPPFAGSVARTVAAGTVRFTLGITAEVAGSKITADENGTASFRRRRAHLYKLVPGGGLPREVIVIGPFTYTNANVQAALSDPAVPPWTKLDRRRLSAAQRRSQADELAHVVAPAYLAYGVARPVRLAAGADGSARYRGRVDPALLARRLPAAQRGAISTAVANDYARTPFPATFWLGPRGRIRRVRVAYTTPKGTRITVDTSYDAYGIEIPVRLPPAGEIKDISPR